MNSNRPVGWWKETHMTKTRQQVLILYLQNSSLDSQVMAWTRYDGHDRDRYTTGDSDEPPYETGLDAVCDGWRLLQVAQLLPPTGIPYDTSFLNHEFYFEHLEAVDG